MNSEFELGKKQEEFQLVNQITQEEYEKIVIELISKLNTLHDDYTTIRT